MFGCWSLVLLLGVSCALVDGYKDNSTLSEKADCDLPFEAVGGRCIYVDILDLGTWQASRDLCHGLGGDLVKVDSGDFFADLVRYINGNGLPVQHYWIGATDAGHDGVWLWVDGSPVQMGTPFWATLECNPVIQRPTGVQERDCVYLDHFFHFYFNDWFCDKESATPICEV